MKAPFAEESSDLINLNVVGELATEHGASTISNILYEPFEDALKFIFMYCRVERYDR